MMSEEIGHVALPCVQSTVIEMQEGFAGDTVTLPVSSLVLLLYLQAGPWIFGY